MIDLWPSVGAQNGVGGARPVTAWEKGMADDGSKNVQNAAQRYKLTKLLLKC